MRRRKVIIVQIPLQTDTGRRWRRSSFKSEWLRIYDVKAIRF